MSSSGSRVKPGTCGACKLWAHPVGDNHWRQRKAVAGHCKREGAKLRDDSCNAYVAREPSFDEWYAKSRAA